MTLSAICILGFHRLGAAQPDARASYTYVTTPHFLSAFGVETLRDLPNLEALEDAGLLGRHFLQNAAETSKDEGEEEATSDR